MCTRAGPVQREGPGGEREEEGGVLRCISTLGMQTHTVPGHSHIIAHLARTHTQAAMASNKFWGSSSSGESSESEEEVQQQPQQKQQKQIFVDSDEEDVKRVVKSKHQKL
jgi:hypothetical protein